MVSVVLGFICMQTSFFFWLLQFCHFGQTDSLLSLEFPGTPAHTGPFKNLHHVCLPTFLISVFSNRLVNSLAHCVQEAWVFCCSVLSNSWMNPFWSWHIVERINCNKLIKIFHDKTLFAVWRDSFKMETPHKNHIVNADASVHLVLRLIYSPSMVIIFWPCSLSGRLPGCAVFEELWHSCQAAPQSFFGLIMVLL